MQRQQRVMTEHSPFVPADEDPIYDLHAAMERLDGDQELFRKLVEFYIEDYPRLLERLELAVAAGQPAEVQRAAHSLKNLAATFDGKRAMGAAQKMEEFSRLGNLPGAAHLLPELRQELLRLQETLARYVAGSSS